MRRRPSTRIYDPGCGGRPVAPEAGQQVNLTSTSSDPDGAIAATNWDLDDDGAFDDASGLVATTTFPTPGSFDVAVEVTDNEGATDIELKTINVAAPFNAPPSAAFTFAPTNPAAGQNVVFDSTSSDPDGSVAALDWDFDGDGQFDDGSGGKVTRSFPVNGLFPVALRATDDDGATDTETRSIQVGPPAARGRYLHGQGGDRGGQRRGREADRDAGRRRDRGVRGARSHPRARRRRRDLRGPRRRQGPGRRRRRRSARQQGSRPNRRRPGPR